MSAQTRKTSEKEFYLRNKLTGKVQGKAHEGQTLPDNFELIDSSDLTSARQKSAEYLASEIGSAFNEKQAAVLKKLIRT